MRIYQCGRPYMQIKPDKDVLGHTDNDRDAPTVNGVDLDWDEFRIFAAVARAGSFTRAAFDLGVQQPTVSRRIESLESKLGTKLFDRGPRGPVLTYEGTRILNEVIAAGALFERAARRARHAEQSVEGECKVIMTDGLASFWFVRNFLPLFVRHHPNIDLRLFVTTEQGRSFVPPFDIQLQFAPTTDQNLVSTKLATYHFNFFASRGYVAENGAPSMVDDLVRHRLIDVANSLTSPGHLVMYSVAKRSSRPTLFTNSGALAAETVLSGAAIGFLPSCALLTSPDFVPVIPGFHFPTGVFASFARETAERAPVRAMLNFLRDVVFNRRRMPWFDEEFNFPHEGWRTAFRELLAEADLARPYKPAEPGSQVP